MKRHTLLFVEEVKSSLSQKVIERKDINVVLLRFEQSISLFDNEYLKKTESIPSFVYNKVNGIEDEVVRFKKFCKTHKIDITSFYNDSEYNQELVQEFAQRLNLPDSLNKYQSLCVRDKAKMKDFLQEIGFRTMPYQEISSVEDVAEFAKKCGGFPIIVKWRKGLSSKEVYKINSINQLKKLSLNLSSGRFIVEQFSPHLIWCVDSLVQEGVVVGTFYAWLPYTNLSFAEKKEKFAQITVSKKPEWFKFDGTKMSQAIVSELGLKNGYMHLEAFVDPFGQPTICEFAWRTPGEHMLLNHSKVFGIDVYDLLIDIMVKKSNLPKELKGNKSVGDMFLPIKDGVIKEISSFTSLKKNKGVIGGEVYYKANDTLVSMRQYTSSAGWVQVEGKSENDVLEKMINVYSKFVLVTKKNR